MTRFQLLIIFLLSINLSTIGQYVDIPPSGRQNYLPYEGGSELIKIDTTTSLDNLIARLNGEWRFSETGKLYWVGYTRDMFSIAARSDLAIQPLIKLAENSSNEHAKIGAIYTLHLIGIDRRIAGRFYEEFVNVKARKALLYLLKYTDLQPTIMQLLIRDPWFSDIPQIFQAMTSCKANCWSLVNGLIRYDLKEQPIKQPIPEKISSLYFKLKHTNQMVLEPNFDFEAQLKEALYHINKLGKTFIVVDEALFKNKLWGNLQYKLANKISLGEFLQRITTIDYDELGNKIQYYIMEGKLYICFAETAKHRWLNWWQNQTSEQKNTYNQDLPILRRKK